jgi:hypothetical protein
LCLVMCGNVQLDDARRGGGGGCFGSARFLYTTNATPQDGRYRRARRQVDKARNSQLTEDTAPLQRDGSA